MLFYFQKKQWFLLFSYVPIYEFNQPTQLLTIIALCTSLAEQRYDGHSCALTVATSLFSSCELLSVNISA